MENVYLLFTGLAFLLLCSVTTSSSDEGALLAFKSRITLDPSTTITNNWSTGSSYCNRVGVSCGHGHRRVIALNLPNMGLQGTIAPQLGNLSFLTVFNISFNRFHGQLPHEMGHLRRLEVIDLQHNQFTGSVPASLGSLPNLQSSVLSFNNFTGKIPTPLYNISKLESLGLPGNRLYGNIPGEIEAKSEGIAGNAERENGILQGWNLFRNQTNSSASIPLSSSVLCSLLQKILKSITTFVLRIGVTNFQIFFFGVLSTKGRRLMSLNRQEVCEKCRDMGREEGDATPIPEGKEAVNSRECREPVRPSHSSSPDHSDEGKGSGKPPL